MKTIPTDAILCTTLAREMRKSDKAAALSEFERLIAEHAETQTAGGGGALSKAFGEVAVMAYRAALAARPVPAAGGQEREELRSLIERGMDVDDPIKLRINARRAAENIIAAGWSRHPEPAVPEITNAMVKSTSS